jgi:hypothetical protein
MIYFLLFLRILLGWDAIGVELIITMVILCDCSFILGKCYRWKVEIKHITASSTE